MHTTIKELKREWNGEAHIGYIINVKNFSKNGLAKKFGWSLDTCLRCLRVDIRLRSERNLGSSTKG